jgi:hypothetical protein
MKTYLSLVAILATNLGIANLAMAHGGGGGGMHFGGGGAHFSMPALRERAGAEHHGFVPEFREDHGGHDHLWDHRRHVFWGGGWPYYDYEGGGYVGSNSYSNPSVSDSDSVVAAVQQALTRKGYYRGPIDGAFGAMTQGAIAGYERDHRLPMAGTIDQALLRSLDME